MGKLFEVFGLLTILAAIMLIGVTKTAFQETTTAILWCGGWLIFASGAILRRLEKSFTVVPGERPKANA